MNINIDVDLDRDVDAIRDRIVKAAAHEMLAQVSPYSDGDEHFTKLAQSLRGDISQSVRAEVEKAVVPAVNAALENGVQRTDNYGSPTGPLVSLREVIVEEAQKALNKKVEIRDNYGRSESVVQQVIRDEVQKALAEELKAAIRDEKVKVQAAVREKAADIITESVRKSVPF